MAMLSRRIIEHNNQEDEAVSKGPLRGARRADRCTYCNFRGHTFENCRKRRQARDAENEED